MQRRPIKHSFVGLPLPVTPTPFQSVFQKECGEANLDTDVCQIFSGLQKELIGEMMDGACALSQNRRSDDVAAEDLLCHLDTQWKVDPLLVSKNCYKVDETDKKVDLSLPTPPLPRQRRRRRCSNTKKTAPKVKKMTKKQLKEKEKEDHKRMMAICYQMVFKVPYPLNMFRNPPNENPMPLPVSKHPMPLPVNKHPKPLPVNKHPKPLPMMKKPELKAETQTSNNIMSRPDIIEFFGNKHKRYSFDSLPNPSPVVQTYKSNSELEKKSSICERMIKFHPSKGRPGFEFKAPKPHPKSVSITMHERKQNITDAVSEKSPETSTYKPKSMVHGKMSTCHGSKKVFPFKEKTELELKVAKQPSIKMSSCQDKLLVRFPGIKLNQEVSGVDGVLKLSPETPICKPESKVEEKRSTCEHLIKVFPSKRKTELELKFPKQPSIEKQVFKMHDKQSKQEVSDVNCASVETERQPSFEIPCLDSQVLKKHGKKPKQEVFDINGVPIETPEAARKRLAIILLRIAGRYQKD